jgi:NADH-quinone oxidoreductase subunit H
MLAELNRTPFDLTEAEAELVAGYNVEYSSIVFSMFFLGEYSNMLVMSSLFCIFYLGGSYSNLLFYNSNILFSLKVLFVAFLIVLIRATFPRYRYDQLMYLG